jgi:hypothetical protein
MLLAARVLELKALNKAASKRKL